MAQGRLVGVLQGVEARVILGTVSVQGHTRLRAPGSIMAADGFEDHRAPEVEVPREGRSGRDGVVILSGGHWKVGATAFAFAAILAGGWRGESFGEVRLPPSYTPKD